MNFVSRITHLASQISYLVARGVFFCLLLSSSAFAHEMRPAYLELRQRPDEIFLETVNRVGVEPFKERVYAAR